MQPNLFEPEKWKELRPLRPRQERAIEAIRQAVKEGHKRIIVQAPTGFGKTLTAAHLISNSTKKGKRPLFTCPAITLVNQTLKSFEDEGIQDIGVIQAQHERTDWLAQVQIASVQTLTRRSLPEVDFVLIDECFPAGTLVGTMDGDIPIEDIEAGNIVYNATGIGFVLSSFKATHKQFATVRLSNGTSFRCTPDHPIFTDSGWKKAGELEVRQRVFDKEGVRTLWEYVRPPDTSEWYPQRQAGGGIPFQTEAILQSILCQEIGKSDAQDRDAGKGIDHSNRHEAYTEAGREWEANAGDTAFGISGSRAGMVRGACSENLSQASAGLSSPLQVGSGASYEPHLYRTGWTEPQIVDAQGAGREEGRATERVWVESVEIEEQPCEEPIYNLRVSGHPSYFANGILVHNCHIQFDKLNELLTGEAWKDKIVIGLSATPWAKGMGLIWTKLIIAATVAELIEEGFLCPFQGFEPEDKYLPETKSIKITAGEFNENQAAAAMDKPLLVGNVVETWLKYRDEGVHTGDRTFLFAQNCAHAKSLRDEFSLAGISFGYIDAYSDPDERRETFRRFRSREDKGICSVGCLTTGVDEDVQVIIDAALTRSEITHVQKNGRGLRTADGKEFLLILDHAGNNRRLGTVTDIYHDHLDIRTKKDKGDAYKEDKPAKKPKKCAKCGALVAAGKRACGACGEKLASLNTVQSSDGELVEFGSKKKSKASEFTIEQKQGFYSGLLHLAREHGRSDGMAAHRYREKFGVFPRGLDKVPTLPSSEVRAFDTHARIRYIKSKRLAVKDNPQVEAYAGEF